MLIHGVHVSPREHTAAQIQLAQASLNLKELKQLVQTHKAHAGKKWTIPPVFDTSLQIQQISNKTLQKKYLT